jgi:hypothetical protein
MVKSIESIETLQTLLADRGVQLTSAVLRDDGHPSIFEARLAPGPNAPIGVTLSWTRAAVRYDYTTAGIPLSKRAPKRLTAKVQDAIAAMLADMVGAA